MRPYKNEIDASITDKIEKRKDKPTKPICNIIFQKRSFQTKNHQPQHRGIHPMGFQTQQKGKVMHPKGQRPQPNKK
jgi:hypothetical protein